MLNKFYTVFCTVFSMVLFLANIFGYISISMWSVFYPIFLLWLVRAVVLATAPDDSKIK